MKVSEAKTKVCPFIQDGRVFMAERQNYSESIVANINCICGDCMAWVRNGTLEGEEDGYCKKLS